ncbi:MAG TPA: LysR substrate-binding domain-containing protein [Mesorhizobium sp.]|nr:LysR substrate-binding domain-containing protein [Mesorhizobium sp.]
MEIRALRTFLAVAQAAGFRRAAAQLSLRQSVVSKRVRDLEDELGVSLFERTAGGARLTDAGDRFEVDARAFLAQLDDAVLFIKASGHVSQGRLRIGLSGSLSSGFPRLLLSTWVREHPSVKLEFRECGPRELVRRINNRQIDVTLLTASKPPLGCDSVPLFNAHLFAAVSREDTIGQLAEVPFEALAEQRFIVSRGGFGPEFHNLLVKRLSDLGFSPEIEVVDVEREALVTLVGLGLGATLVSDPSTGVSYPGVAFVRISGEALPVNAVYSPDNDNPALRRFLSLARVLAKQQACGGALWRTPGLSP